jgi:hypothetical protein
MPSPVTLSQEGPQHMPLMPSPERRVLVAADMQRYSRHSNLDQYRSQKVFQEVMQQAANHACLHREAWITQPSGDGEFSVLPPGTAESTVISDFVPALEKLLREHNRTLIPEHRTKIRVALHTGLVHLDGANGIPGRGAIHVSRLVDAKPLKEALVRYPDAAVGLIVSDSIYHECVSERYEGIRPELFHKVQVDVKEFSEIAWIYLPGEDIKDLDPRPASLATTPNTPRHREDESSQDKDSPTARSNAPIVQGNTFNGPALTTGSMTVQGDFNWGP